MNFSRGLCKRAFSSSSTGKTQMPTALFGGRFLRAKTSMDIVTSGGTSIFHLFLSQEKRDECLQYINKGIINAPVLGIPMTLSLYNDLRTIANMNKERESDFNAEDFIAGSRLAIEEYHHVENELLNESVDHLLDELKKEKNVSIDYNNYTFEQKKESTEAITTKEEEKDSLFLHEHKDVENLMYTQNFLQGLMNDTFEKITDVKNIADIRTISVEESLKQKASFLATSTQVDQLKKMMTNWLFENCLFHLRMSPIRLFLQYFPKIPKFAKQGTVSVGNLALLSVRTRTLHPSDLEMIGTDIGKKVDDTSDNKELDYPVVAQVEVLYDTLVPGMDTFSAIKEREELKSHLDVKSPQSSSQKIIEEEKKDSTTTLDESEDTVESSSPVNPSVNVAVFEGFLHNSPDGSLQWKLTDIRPPWEFQ